MDCSKKSPKKGGFLGECVRGRRTSQFSKDLAVGHEELRSSRAPSKEGGGKKGKGGKHSETNTLKVDRAPDFLM